MTGRFPDIGQVLAEVQLLHRQIAAASSAGTDGWRQEVVRLRRRMAEQIGALIPLVSAGRPGSDTPQFDGFRKAVSRFRTAVAEHQAQWPAVLLDARDPAYVESVTRLRSAHENMDESFHRLESG